MHSMVRLSHYFIQDPRMMHHTQLKTPENLNNNNNNNNNNTDLFIATIIKIFDTLKYTCLNIYEYIRVTAIAAAAAMPPCNNEN